MTAGSGWGRIFPMIMFAASPSSGIRIARLSCHFLGVVLAQGGMPGDRVWRILHAYRPYSY